LVCLNIATAKMPSLPSKTWTVAECRVAMAGSRHMPETSQQEVEEEEGVVHHGKAAAAAVAEEVHHGKGVVHHAATAAAVAAAHRAVVHLPAGATALVDAAVPHHAVAAIRVGAVHRDGVAHHVAAEVARAKTRKL